MTSPFFFESFRGNDTLIVFDFCPWDRRKESIENFEIMHKFFKLDILVAGNKKSIAKKTLKKDLKDTIDSVIKNYKYVLFSGVQIGSLFVKAKKASDVMFHIYDYEGIRLAFTESPTFWESRFNENIQSIFKVDVDFVRGATPLESDIVKEEVFTLDELRSKLRLKDGDRDLPISIDIETTGKKAWTLDQKIISCSVATELDKGYSFLIDHPRFSSMGNGLNMLKWICSLPNTKIAHNAKFEYVWIEKLYRVNIESKLLDTMLISHFLNENLSGATSRYSLAGSIVTYLNKIPHKEEYLSTIETGEKEKKLNKKKASWDDILELKRKCLSTYKESNEKDFTLMSRKDLIDYGVLDVVSTLRVFYKQIEFVRTLSTPKAFNFMVTDLQNRIVRTLGTMEWNGLRINTDTILDTIKYCEEIISKESDELAKIADINFTSKKELSELIAEKYPEIDELLERDSRDDFILDKDSLKGLGKKYPWLNHLVHYRHGYKAKNTYLLSYLQYACGGRIHFDFLLNGTVTGRLSCNKPNMQNIPKSIGKKAKDGYEIKLKTPFLADEGKALINMDLSNAEIRMLACYTKDENLIATILSGNDFHSMTASNMFKVPYEAIIAAKEKDGKLTEQEEQYLRYRSQAKAVSFGIPYGTSARGMSEKMGISEQEAQALIDGFYATYPKVKPWIDSMKDFVRKNKYVETYFGRRRRFPILFYSNSPYTISRIERQAVNFLIQSSTSDWFQYLIYDIMQIPGITAHITVHDSLVYSVDLNVITLQELNKRLTEILVDKPAKIWSDLMSVPILFDGEIGMNYGSLGKFDKFEGVVK